MDLRNLQFALSAMQHVRMTLNIASSNRPGDNRPDGFMVPLEDAKATMSSRLFELKQQTFSVLCDRIAAQQQRLLQLRSLQSRLGTELNEKERFERQFNQADREVRVLQQVLQKPVQAMQIMMTLGREFTGLNDELSRLQRRAQEQLMTTIEEDVIICAHAARATQRGNCDEMSSLAFLYLRDINVKPIDLVESEANAKDDVHQFVVIGRKRDEPLNDPASWTTAVVCDVWDQSACEGEHLMVKLAGLGYPSQSLHLRLRDE